jgi:hypothetical protein
LPEKTSVAHLRLEKVYNLRLEYTKDMRMKPADTAPQTNREVEIDPFSLLRTPIALRWTLPHVSKYGFSGEKGF